MKYTELELEIDEVEKKNVLLISVGLGEIELNLTFIFTPDIYLGTELGEVISNYMTQIGENLKSLSYIHMTPIEIDTIQYINSAHD